MKWASFWYKLFCASIALELRIIQILFLTELISILVSWHTSFLSDHFTHMHPVLSVYCDSDPAASKWTCYASLSPLPCTPLCTACAHNELCLVKPVALDPPTTFYFRHLCISVKLPWKQGCREGRHMRKKIPIMLPISVASITLPELLVTILSPDGGLQRWHLLMLSLSHQHNWIACAWCQHSIMPPKVPSAQLTVADGPIHTIVTDGLLHVTDHLLHAAVTYWLCCIIDANRASHVDAAYTSCCVIGPSHHH